MSYNDIATSPHNPIPGKLFDQPSGEDIYHGCPIDFEGKEVSAEMFHKVLRGDGDKTLKSSPESNVFIYFTGRGDQSLLHMPDNSFIFADELQDSIKFMH